MPIRTVETHRLYRQIADQLSALIAGGEFATGARLPSERDLAVQLGVSRPCVREALIALEIGGRVEVRVGAGIFVCSPRPMAVADPTREGQGPFELLRARWLIEGEIAAEAARKASPQDLESIRATVVEMRRHHRRGADSESSDREFHLAIARATHNSVLVSVVQELWDTGRGAMWRRMELHFQTPALRATCLSDHRAIVHALDARDGRAARAAMRHHLERVDREFTRGWELLKEQESTEASDEQPIATRRGGAR